MKSSDASVSILLGLCALVTLPAAAGAISTDRPAAIVTFPHVVVDTANGVDTFLQLVNVDDSNAIDVLCFLEDANRHCDNDNSICGTEADCSGGLCTPGWQVSDFVIRLTRRQPFGWHASAGAISLPHPSNVGSIPPAQEDPFRGALRCLVVDENGAPVDQNVLMGAATVERHENGQSIDAARYNPIGFAAIPGANNGDTELVMGVEYESCPNAVLANHFFDFAIDPMTHSSEIFTSFVFVPCSGDYFFQQPGSAVVQYTVWNEFEQRLSTSRTVLARFESPMSLIDTNIGTRSIFSAGVAGTLTGQTRAVAIGDGIVGVAVERHQAVGQPAGTSAAAAFNLHSQGQREDPDILLVGLPPICRFEPDTNCRTAGTSSLLIRDRESVDGDELKWKLRAVQATDLADLGDPQATTVYGLCIYDGATEALLTSAEVPASPSKWQPLSNGLRYKDEGAAEDGVARIILRTSDHDRARVSVDAEGANLALPALPLQTPLLVQLVNSVGNCWEAVYDAGDVIDNSSVRFKAKQ